MDREIKHLPWYCCSVYIDGYTYQLSICFQSGHRNHVGELPHSHAQCELHGVFRGEIKLEIEGTEAINLQKGDCCLVPPQLYHLRRINSEDVHCCAVSIESPKGAPLNVCLLGCSKMQCSEVLIGYLTALENELHSRQFGTDASVQSLCTLLVTALIRERILLPKTVKMAKPTTAGRAELIDNFFANYYGQDITARSLADYIGITTRQLSRIMQKRYGCTFRQRLLEIRLYHARDQLIATEKNVGQIAADCGFTCQGAFSTAFNNQVGCTPSQYRKLNRK